jgi:hypothetical protein
MPSQSFSGSERSTSSSVIRLDVFIVCAILLVIGLWFVFYGLADADDGVDKTDISSLAANNSHCPWANTYLNAQGQRRDAIRLLFSCGAVSSTDITDVNTKVDQIEEYIWVAAEMLQEKHIQEWTQNPQIAHQAFENKMRAQFRSDVWKQSALAKHGDSCYDAIDAERQSSHGDQESQRTQGTQSAEGLHTGPRDEYPNASDTSNLKPEIKAMSDKIGSAPSLKGSSCSEMLDSGRAVTLESGRGELPTVHTAPMLTSSMVGGGRPRESTSSTMLGPAPSIFRNSSRKIAEQQLQDANIPQGGANPMIAQKELKLAEQTTSAYDASADTSKSATPPQQKKLSALDPMSSVGSLRLQLDCSTPQESTADTLGPEVDQVLSPDGSPELRTRTPTGTFVRGDGDLKKFTKA